MGQTTFPQPLSLSSAIKQDKLLAYNLSLVSEGRRALTRRYTAALKTSNWKYGMIILKEAGVIVGHLLRFLICPFSITYISFK